MIQTSPGTRRATGLPRTNCSGRAIHAQSRTLWRTAINPRCLPEWTCAGVRGAAEPQKTRGRRRRAAKARGNHAKSDAGRSRPAFARGFFSVLLDDTLTRSFLLVERISCAHTSHMSTKFPYFDHVGLMIATCMLGLVDTVHSQVPVAWGGMGGRLTLPTERWSSVVQGDRNTVLISLLGRISCFGANRFGECDPPSDLPPVKRVALGTSHCIALGVDGQVRCWGWNVAGQCQVPQTLNVVVDVAAGVSTSFALDADGTVTQWGKSIGLTWPSTGIVAMSASADSSGFSFGRTTSDGQHYIYYNWVDRRVDRLPIGGRLTVGVSHALHVSSTGMVTSVSWGDYTDTLPADLGPVIDVAVGRYHSVAVLLDGSVRMWGDASRGQASAPADLSEVKSLSAGGTRTSCVTADGQFVSWGEAPYASGQASDRTGSISQLSISSLHMVALRADGAVDAWGHERFDATEVPTELRDVSQVAGGMFHSIALRTDGTVVCWGSGSEGQCSVPLDMLAVSQIAAGDVHSLALQANGVVRAWGSNSSGQSTVPADLGACALIGSGQSHSLAALSTGAIRGWGLDYDGQCQPPQDLSAITQLAAGRSHSVALSSSGIVRCWGSNVRGQCNVPTDLPPVRSIAAGRQHTIALCKDGAVHGWGDNLQGQSASRSFGGVVTAIAATGSHSIALVDECPEYSNFGVIGQCGCGQREVDTDSDSVADCIDPCPYDPTVFTSGECDCLGDLNSDGFVGASDMPMLLNAWGSMGVSIADIDYDGVVGAQDLAMLLARWGPCP
jgi:alpha-tubulin suppressor-like RCC1 family protein